MGIRAPPGTCSSLNLCYAINKSDQKMKKVMSNNGYITFTGSVWFQGGTA